MDTLVTDSVQSLPLESDSFQALTETLQVLLAQGLVLTLVLFVGEGVDGKAVESQHIIKADMDDVAQLLLACFRRSDMVVRCGEACCAAILLGAEVDGALRAVHRFQRMLACWKPLAVSLRVGIAAAPAQANQSQSLLALAMKPHLRICPASRSEQDALPSLEAVAESQPAMTPAFPKDGAVQEKGGKGNSPFKPAVPLTPATVFPSEPGLRLLSGGVSARPVEASTRARARALGVPYIAPPQTIPSSVRSLLSVEVMRQLRCLPIGRDRNALTVALADPTNRKIVQQLEQLTGLTIFPVMTDPDALEELARTGRARRASRVAAPSGGPSGD